MSFLDNLENSLKSLESQDERDGQEAERRELERTRAVALAPWSEQLRRSDYTKTLMNEAAKAGHRLRSKIYMAWIGDSLRFELRGRFCELYPTPDGIAAKFQPFHDGPEVIRGISLTGSPGELLDTWLAGVSSVQKAEPEIP